MKVIGKKEKLPKKEVFLKKALMDAQQSLNDAYDGLANVNDPDLIDSYIYELNAANLRYQVILRDYKELCTVPNEPRTVPKELCTVPSLLGNQKSPV